MVELGLVGFFVLLALCEVIFPFRIRPRASSGDARLLTNFSLTAMVLVAGGLVPLARITSSIASERFGVGLAHFAHMPWALILIATLMLDSFAAYWVHRLMHVTPLFWRVHRVHHSDKAVDVSTSFRNHPLELFVTLPPSALVVLVLGSPPSVVLATQTILMMAAIWDHADIKLPPRLNRALSLVIVTPELHRVHHSVDRGEHDSNFGDCLSIWDRLFGTLTRTRHTNCVGLDGERARNDHLLQQIVSPLYPA